MKITKIIQIEDKSLYQALQNLQSVNSLEKFMFYEEPIEDCPRIDSAFYFKLESFTYECISHFVSLRLDTIKDKVLELFDLELDVVLIETQLARFKKICDENNATDYFVITL